MLEAERPVLMPYRGAFDGFHAVSASVSKTCLVRFDRNKYSVAASAVGRPVDIHAYAERIVIKQDGVVVGEHAPIRAQSGGLRSLALRAGAGEEARGVEERRAVQGLAVAGRDRAGATQAAGSHDGDRQMVKILTAVLTDGLAAVEAACAESLAAGIASADVILNALATAAARAAPPIETPERLTSACRLWPTAPATTRCRRAPMEVCHGAH